MGRRKLINLEDEFPTSPPDQDIGIIMTDAEPAELMHSSPPGHPLSCSFGIGWMALDWDKGQPMPENVRRLGMLRGVLNENMDGAGI
jgi:hypothetical protein